MSLSEIAHRSTRLMRYLRDFVCYRAGFIVDYQVNVTTAKQRLFGEPLNRSKCDFQVDIDCFRADWLANRFHFFDPDTSYDLDSPVRWLSDPRTGKISPQKFGRSIDYRDDEVVGEIKYLWELGRHQFLVPMAICVALENDEAVRLKLESHLNGWIEQNPVGMGIHWCSALEVSLRLISWSLVHSILQSGGLRNGIFDLSVDSQAQKSHIHAQVKFVVENYSRYSSANNHLIGELSGVWMTCNVFDLGQRGGKWRDAAMVELEREIQFQTHPDGVNKEQAIYYHLWSLEYFLLGWAIAKRYEKSVSKAFEEKIVSMFLFLKSMCAYTEYPSQIGDSDDGVVSRFSPDISENAFTSLLTAASRMLENADQSTVDFSDPYSKQYWYGKLVEGVDKSSMLKACREGVQGAGDGKAFECGGYYMLEGADSHLLFKAGPFGYLSTAAHSHSDALSITLAINADWWLVDPGTYTYHSAGEWRNYFRSTQAHNTLCVNSENQSEIAGDFLWGRKADVRVHFANRMLDIPDPYLAEVCASHSGYDREGVIHKRHVNCDGLYTYNVLDQVIADEKFESCEFTLAYHFHPAVNLQQLDTHRWLATRHNSELSLVVELPVAFEWSVIRGQRKPILGWYSDRYGIKRPSSTLVGVKRLLHQELQNHEAGIYKTRLLVNNATRDIITNDRRL